MREKIHSWNVEKIIFILLESKGADSESEDKKYERLCSMFSCQRPHLQTI